MKKLLLCVLLLNLSIYSYSQRTSYDFNSFIKDTVLETKRVFVSPYNANLKTSGLIISPILVSYAIDEKIRDVARRNQTRALDTILNRTLKNSGNGGYDILLIGGYYTTARILNNDYMVDTSFLLAESFLVANMYGTVIKSIVGRSRPYTEEGNSKFRPFNRKTAHTSFPSGHTVSAFSIASVFARRSDSTTIKILSYSLAGSVFIQRIYEDKHWSSDVVFGAILGTLIGNDIVNNFNKKAISSSASFSVIPTGDGILLAFNF